MSLKNEKVKVNGTTYEVRQLSVEDVFGAMDGEAIDNLKMLKLCVTKGGKPIDTKQMPFTEAKDLISAMNKINGFVGNGN